VLRPAAAPWTVTPSGAVLAGGAPLGGRSGVLRPGEWVETGSGASAHIRVGRIGDAELGPDSRASLVRAGGSEHRMSLQRGTLHARISAPPRFFLVETPAALAVDLGCVYTLTLNEQGIGVLRVDDGHVELVRAGRRVVVPAGNQASLRRGVGPGLPYPVRASAALRRAVADYDAGLPAAMDSVLAAADSASTITLWHLMQRVAPADRARVDARLRTLVPAPAAVRAGQPVDDAGLRAWRQLLRPGWNRAPIPAWRRAWTWLGGR
jgi:hypothetical protein